MLIGTPGLVVAAAASHRAPLDGHLWHTIEALGFLITSLGGIAVAEFLQARTRRGADRTSRLQVADGANHRIGTNEAFVQSSHVGVIGGGTSSVALLPARVQIDSPPVDPWPTPGARNRSVSLPLVAIAGAAAAAVHFVVMPEHFEEATIYGMFFAVAATSQLLYSALLLIRPSRALVCAGAIGNIAIIALWLVTRTIGIPLGPGAGSVEELGGLDVLATIFEIGAAIGAVTVLCRGRRLTRAQPSTWSWPIWALFPIVAVAIAVTTYLSPPS
jgi:hypothetical protein